MQKTRFLLVSLISLTLACASPQETEAGSGIVSNVDASALAEPKRTRLGLYVTAKEAASVLKDLDNVVLIDVRAPEETMFVGIPKAPAVNIPFKTVDPNYTYDPEKSAYRLVRNEEFVSRVLAYLKSPAAGQGTQTVLLMCRSGGRSAKAVDALATEGGLTTVYSVVDGFEGDKDDNGRRNVNGWKNSGEPWTTKIPATYLYTAQ